MRTWAATSSEAFKVPFEPYWLRRFQPYWLRDRSKVCARLIGFREFIYIYTELPGAVGGDVRVQPDPLFAFCPHQPDRVES